MCNSFKYVHQHAWEEDFMGIDQFYLAVFLLIFSPSLLIVNSTIFLPLKFNLIFPRILNLWLLTLPSGSLAFSPALTFFRTPRLWWWWISFKWTVSCTPRRGTTHCPSSQLSLSIRHGPEPWASTCSQQTPTTPACIWQVTHTYCAPRGSDGLRKSSLICKPHFSLMIVLLTLMSQN